MVAPLMAGRRQGAMAVWRTAAGLRGLELEFLVGLSRQATVAIENARLFAEAQQRAASWIPSTRCRSSSRASSISMRSSSSWASRSAPSSRPTSPTSPSSTGEGHDQLPYQYGEEVEARPFGEGLTSRIIKSGEALILNEDVDREAGAWRAHHGKQALSYLGVPFRAGGEPGRDQRAEHAARRRLRRGRQAPAFNDRGKRRVALQTRACSGRRRMRSSARPPRPTSSRSSPPRLGRAAGAGCDHREGAAAHRWLFGTLWRRAGDQMVLSAYTTTNQAGIEALKARSPLPLNDEDFIPRELQAGHTIVSRHRDRYAVAAVWREVAASAATAPCSACRWSATGSSRRHQRDARGTGAVRGRSRWS